MIILNRTTIVAVQSIVIYPYETFESVVHLRFFRSLLKLYTAWCDVILSHCRSISIIVSCKDLTRVTWVPHSTVSLALRSVSFSRSIRFLAAFLRIDDSVSEHLDRLFVMNNRISSTAVPVFPTAAFIEFFCNDLPCLSSRSIRLKFASKSLVETAVQDSSSWALENPSLLGPEDRDIITLSMIRLRKGKKNTIVN